MKSNIYRYLVILVLLVNTGCTTLSKDCEKETIAEEKQSTLESYNRAMFSFNTKVDKYLIRPVAKGYRAITNEFVRDRVSNFFNNIEEPISAANHILQGELSDSGQNVGRFVVNTTLGAVGLFDVASSMGMEPKKTGFDETMATWCIPDGPYIVLPIMGGSTPRAATGFIVDGYTAPSYWIARGSGNDNKWAYYYGLNGLKYINLLAKNLTLLESLENGSIDYYETMKSTYLQNRNKLPKCGIKQEESIPEYDFDMDIDE